MKTGSDNPLGSMDWNTARFDGPDVQKRTKKLGELAGIFSDRTCWQQMDGSTVVYTVRWSQPVSEGTEGGLFWGTTVIEPGQVGDEYFMTHGHYHSKRDRAEIYGTVSGEGRLILMDSTRRTWVETMIPGSLHYVHGNVAHRIANVGDRPLSVVACWPSDAGHDYGAIVTEGFGARLLCRNGAPVLIKERS